MFGEVYCWVEKEGARRFNKFLLKEYNSVIFVAIIAPDMHVCKANELKIGQVHIFDYFLSTRSNYNVEIVTFS